MKRARKQKDGRKAMLHLVAVNQRAMQAILQLRSRSPVESLAQQLDRLSAQHRGFADELSQSIGVDSATVSINLDKSIQPKKYRQLFDQALKKVCNATPLKSIGNLLYLEEFILGEYNRAKKRALNSQVELIEKQYDSIKSFVEETKKHSTVYEM